MSLWLLGFISVASILMVYFKGYWFPIDRDVPGAESGPQAVLDNYGSDIIKYSKDLGIEPEFAMALCMLESGGRKPVPSRYEKHIYMRLKYVKLHLRDNYEHVTASDLDDAGDEALQNLASSWGPFQLMGYKCLLFDIKVKDLRGDSGVFWGIKWMTKAYGVYLKKKDYKSAFHIHNAGTPYPKSGRVRTYDPDYVQNGLNWMKYFREKIRNK